MPLGLDDAVPEFKKILDERDLSWVRLWLGEGIWDERGAACSQLGSHLRLLLDHIEASDGLPTRSEYVDKLRLAYIGLLEENSKWRISDNHLKFSRGDQSDLFYTANIVIPRDHDLFEAGYNFLTSGKLADNEDTVFARSFLRYHQTDRRLQPTWEDMMHQRAPTPGSIYPSPLPGQDWQGYEGLCMMPKEGGPQNTISLDMIGTMNDIERTPKFNRSLQRTFNDLYTTAKEMQDPQYSELRSTIESALPKPLEFLLNRLNF
tara:strand:+ start:700 stop:1485 length:786 start_codon:yes stop_codon:yes gene_type:complete